MRALLTPSCQLARASQAHSEAPVTCAVGLLSKKCCSASGANE